MAKTRESVASQPTEEPVLRGGATRLLRIPRMLLALTVLVSLLVAGIVAATRTVDRVQEIQPQPARANTTTVDRAEAARVADAFLDAWAARRWQRLQRLISDQNLDAASVHRQAFDALAVTRATFNRGPVRVDGDLATMRVRARWVLDELDAHRFRTDLVLERVAPTEVTAGDRPVWRVAWWYPTVHPDLTPSARFERVREFPDRAAILDRRGDPLVRTDPVVEIGFEPRRVTRQRPIVRQVARLTEATPADVRATLSRDDLQGNQFYGIVSVPRARFGAIRDRLAPIAGVLFRERQDRIVDAPDGFSSWILGRTDDITAELLDEYGEPYGVGDRVGVSGLESTYEERLAGVPAVEARIVDDVGLVRSLAHRPGAPAKALRTGLDPVVQRAAEQTATSLAGPTALVAIDVRSGGVLAAATGASDGRERALSGQYPPGSSFKIVTATGALLRGVRPVDTVGCPRVAEAGGRRFSNAGDFVLGRIPFARAFAASCNTTFVAQGLQLGDDSLLDAAANYGFNVDYSLGVLAGGGSIPEPADSAELGADSIGQGRVLASPLHMASVAAAVRSGTWKAPHIVRGGEAAPRPLPDGAVRLLRPLMRQVVTSGTGTAAEVAGSPQVHGKTGTAEFGTTPPFGNHGWFVGYRGDIAFAVIVEGGGGGGAVAAPVAADFLRTLSAMRR